MRNILNLKLLLLFFYTSTPAIAKDINIVESPKGIYFDSTPASTKDAIIGHTFIMKPDEWNRNRYIKYDKLMNLISNRPLFNDEKHYILVTRAKNIIPLPINQVITKERYFTPSYHQRLFRSFEMKELVNLKPKLVFETTRTELGVKLKTNLTADMFTQDQIMSDSNLNSIFGKSNVSDVSVIYSDEFNALFDRLIAVSEFYNLNGSSTVVETVLIVSVKKSVETNGYITGPVFRAVTKKLINDTAVESINALNELLGIK